MEWVSVFLQECFEKIYAPVKRSECPFLHLCYVCFKTKRIASKRCRTINAVVKKGTKFQDKIEMYVCKIKTYETLVKHMEFVLTAKKETLVKRIG